MKRLLSIMLALMLMLSMTATAFATETETEQTKDKVTTPEAYVTKQYNDPVGHAATFSFDVTPIGPKFGPNLTINSISYDATETRVNKTSKLVFAAPTSVGEFSYTVKENQAGETTDPTSKNMMVMSDAQYRVEISVTKDAAGKIAITSINVYKTHDDQGVALTTKEVKVGADDFKFVNTYAEEAGSEDPEYGTNGSLRISKTVVQGNDAAQEFQFYLTCEFPGDVNPFTPTITHSGGQTINLNVGRATPFTLKNGEWIKFTGLPYHTKVTVEEAGTTGFTPSLEADFGGDPATISGRLDEGISVVHTLEKKSNTVDVTNTRNYTPPTGVILNVLPYVLMVAIAGGMIVLFTVMKRRKAQDFED